MKLSRIYLVMMCSFIHLKIYYAELYSSLSKLETLLDTQKSVIETIEYFFKANKSENRIVKRYLEVFRTEHQAAMEDVRRYLGNPINSFRLIKRLTADLDYIEKVLKNQIKFERSKNLIYPTQDDMNGAAMGIDRIQYMYYINTTRLADGIWNTSLGTSTFSSPLSVSDCYELGKAMYRCKKFTRGMEWLKEAARKTCDTDQTIREWNRYTLEEIQNEILSGNKRVDNIRTEYLLWYYKLLAFNPKIEFLDPYIIETFYRRGFSPNKTIEAIRLQQIYKLYHSLDVKQLSSYKIYENYLALCRSENVKDESATKWLSCYYAHGPHPYLILAPIKAERLHLNPNITMFYNIITDSEIQDIQDLALPRLYHKDPKADDNSDIAIGKPVHQIGYVFANESTRLTSVRTRVAQVTGLKLATDEPLWVYNYGIGGHCPLRYYYYTNYLAKLKEDNMLATFSFYLSDVDEGGTTVFPALGLAVRPVKGCALFWMNLLPAGQGDPYSVYAVCPVLQGYKWEAVQWINSRP